MIKVAIVCAAGYKGIGWGFPNVPPVCPECLLPIGEKYGSTPVARLCTQLKKLGWKSFVTVGQPTSRYPGILAKAVKNTVSHFPQKAFDEVVNKAPWTYERYQYIAQYGVPLLMTDPDMKGPHDSTLQSLDFIGFDWWNTLAVLYCDHIWTDEGLRSVLACKPPCQAVIPDRLTVEILTPKTARIYRRLGNADKYRARRHNFTMKSKRFWGEPRLPPEGLKFEKHVPYRTVLSSAACSEDLDTPGRYRNVKERWLPKYG